MSRCVSVTHSASREIGTQTSVATMAAPGPQREVDSAASWRACHSRVRSSGRVVQSNGPPPNSAAISPKRLRLLGHRRFGAVEFEEQHRRFRQAELGMQLHARTCSASSNSMRATGMPDWMVGIAALQPASTEGNGQTPPEIASGMPGSFSVNSVMTPSVPSEPTISRVRS